MSRRDRYANITLALVAFAVLVLMIAVLWAIISEQYARIHQSYSAYQQTAEQDRRDTADEIARACQGMESVAFADCIADRIGSYYRDQATNQDLQAQQDMAFWAQWMFIATIFTVLLTAFGIWLVYMNLREARRVTTAAVEGTEAAQKTVIEAEKTTAQAKRQADFQEHAYRRLERPYLFIKITDTALLRNPQHSFPRIDYTIANYGKTPAVLRSVYAELVPTPKLPLRVPLNSDEPLYEVIEPGEKILNEKNVVVKDSEPGDRWVGRVRGKLVFHGLITYEDPTGALHQDRFCLRCNEGSGFHVEGGKEYNYRKTIYPEDRDDSEE